VPHHEHLDARRGGTRFRRDDRRLRDPGQRPRAGRGDGEGPSLADPGYGIADRCSRPGAQCRACLRSSGHGVERQLGHATDRVYDLAHQLLAPEGLRRKRQPSSHCSLAHIRRSCAAWARQPAPGSVEVYRL
jgi:hypothetical protein